MTKYTLKQINKNAVLHDKEFVVVDDVSEMMRTILIHAVECGADEDKLMEALSDE